jgi:hypothetical protein
MDVADPTAFAVTNKAANELVVARAMAALLSVQQSAVTVTLSIGTRTRRLAAAALRRLTTTGTTYVIATTVITVADAAAATTLQIAAAAKTPAEINTGITTQLLTTLTQAQVTALGINVTSASAVVTTTTTTNSTSSSSTTSAGSGTASGAIKTSFSVAPLFAVSAWLLLSHV